MCDNILRLLAVNVPAMDVVLWPHLLDYLLAPDFNAAIPSIVKCLSHLVILLFISTLVSEKAHRNESRH